MGSRLGQRIPAFTTGRPGGFWVRLVALFIDGIVVAPIIALLVTTFTDFSISEYVAYYVDEDSIAFSWDIERFNFVDILYHAILVGLWSTTVGKKALGLYVLRADGRPTGFWRALVRETAKILSAFLLFVGFFIALFREDRRTLHDLIAGTVVVKR